MNFTDNKTNTTIHAPLDDSLIRGTLRTCDLVPVFLEAIRDTPEYVQITQSNIPELQVIFDAAADDTDERWDSEYISYFLNEELFDVLNGYAPDGYYFGSHMGNGSDFGYWEVEDEY